MLVRWNLTDYSNGLIKPSIVSVNLIATVLLCFLPQVQAGILDDIKPGQWYEIKNSHMRDVAPCRGTHRNAKPNCDSSRGDPSLACYKSYALKDIDHIMFGWNGAAYDTKRERLIIFGGGHKGWAGNDIYTFDLNTFKWTRVSNASCISKKDATINIKGVRGHVYYEDGSVRARHTYNYIQYIPALDSLCSFGGGGGNNLDCYNFSKNKWEFKIKSPSYGSGTFSAVDPSTGLVWVRANARNSTLSVYNPLENQFDIKRNHDGHKFLYNWTAALDYKGRTMLAVGGKRKLKSTLLWEIDDKNVAMKTLKTTGALEIEKAKNPGLQYDSVANKYIAWDGGVDVYSFDVNNNKWTRHPAASSNKINPGKARKNGTYGRFRYSEKHNIYVLVNSVDKNVYLYRFMRR